MAVHDGEPVNPNTVKSAVSASDAVASLAATVPEVHESLIGTEAGLSSEKSLRTVNVAVFTGGAGGAGGAGGTTFSVLTIVHSPSASDAVHVPELV